MKLREISPMKLKNLRLSFHNDNRSTIRSFNTELFRSEMTKTWLYEAQKSLYLIML